MSDFEIVLKCEGLKLVRDVKIHSGKLEKLLEQVSRPEHRPVITGPHEMLLESLVFMYEDNHYQVEGVNNFHEFVHHVIRMFDIRNEKNPDKEILDETIEREMRGYLSGSRP